MTNSHASEIGWNDLGTFSFRQIRRDRIGLVELGREQGGDYACGTVAGRFRVHLLSDPSGIQHVLVRNQRNFIRGEPKGSPLMRALGPGLLLADGDAHLRQRRLIQPAFHPKRVAEYSHVVADQLNRLIADWSARNGSTTDMHQEMMQFAMLVIAKVLFDVDVSGNARRLGQSITHLNELAILLGFSITGWMPWLPTPANLRMKRAIRRLDESMYTIIRDRRESGADKGDVLSALLHAQDEQSPEGQGGGRMTDTQIRNEALVLFAAGHETTANMMTFTWYLLAQHPEIEERLHAELDEVLGGRTPGVEDLPRLPFTDCVLRESLRLYPPAWINGRRSLASDEVEGHPLPADALVLMSPYVVHRDPRWFDRPEHFDPDRFAVEASHPRFAYFPFGGGVRQCIGQSFAEMEGRIALAGLAQHFTPKLVPGQRLELEPMITLRPKGGLAMQLLPRH